MLREHLRGSSGRVRGGLGLGLQAAFGWGGVSLRDPAFPVRHNNASRALLPVSQAGEEGTEDWSHGSQASSKPAWVSSPQR